MNPKTTPQEEDRPFSIALSREEVIALVKYHSSCARRVPKRFGEAAAKLTRGTFFPKSRELKVLSEVAEDALKKHTTRAKGLLSILPK